MIPAFTRHRAASSSFALDQLASAVACAAYSLLRVRSSYAGACLRVRRSSDNTESDIGFGSNNKIDQSALLSFVGSGDGYVTKWYDQSGLALDAYQTTQGAQPMIVSAGAVTANSAGKTALKFPGSSGSPTAFLNMPYPAALAGSGKAWIHAVGEWVATGNQWNGMVGWGANPSLQQLALTTWSSASLSTPFNVDFTLSYADAAANFAALSTPVILDGFFDGAAINLYANGTKKASSATSRGGVSGVSYIGAQATSVTGSSNFIGTICEAIAFGTSANSADLATLAALCATEYGIA